MRLFVRIRIVVPEIAGASSAKCGLKVDPHGLNVANVEVAIGFWRKSKPQLALCNFLMLMGYFFGVALNFKLPRLYPHQFIPKLVILSCLLTIAIFFYYFTYTFKDMPAVDCGVLLPKPFA